MPQDMESPFSFACGTNASVVWDDEGGPTTADDEVKSEFRTISSDYLEDIDIVSSYSFHIALYALQNPTPENIAKALGKLGVGGDLEDWVDSETLLPLPVPKPNGWDRDL